jgi:predicted outer membrane repeat protein
MLIIHRITLMKKVAFVLGVWILTQLAPGYLSAAAAAECPINTSCVTRYDDDDSILANTGFGPNLRQAVGDTTTSAVLIGTVDPTTISLHTPLEIRKNISISAQVNSEGQNLVTIRPSDTFNPGPDPESTSLIQIFAESATANVTISNLIVNGTSQDSETVVRAIEVIENSIETSTVPLLTLESSSIQNSYGNSNGGAVLTPGDITVSNSTFSDNSAGEYGGAVYAGGEIYVENSTFTDNTANDAGGAIATHSGETITVTNSLFQSNEAVGISEHLYAGGGAIKGGEGLLQIDGSTFSENISNLDGGAVLHFGDLEVTDSVFEANEARFIDNDFFFGVGNGGAIFAVSEDDTDLVRVSIDSSSFLGNKSAGDGGAINITGTLIVTNTHFESNTASIFIDGDMFFDGDGGAIRVQGGIEVNQSSFFSNSAAGDGGAIDIDTLSGFSGDESTSRISSSDFRSNETSSGDGGAIDGSGYVLIVEDSHFLDNYADDDGGAIWSSGLVRVLHSDFSENAANDDGGAIFADSVQINQSLFLRNDATEDGGAINVRNNDGEDVLSAIINTEFNGNVSISGQGNTLYGNAWLLLNSFVNYRSRAGVSAIALETNFGSVSIGNSFVEQNPEVAGDGFCAIGFDYSANNFASDSSCLGSFEVDPVKSRVASPSVDSDGYLAFSDNIFNGETGLLAFDSNPDLLSAFISTARGGLEYSVGRLPSEDEIAAYESIPERRDAADAACWTLVPLDSGCFYEADLAFQNEEDLYQESFGMVTAFNFILEDANDVGGHQFLEDYIFIDRDYFDRAGISTWTAGAVHKEPKPALVSNSNRSISLIKSSGFSSLEEQKIRAERAALAEAKKKAARSLRLAEVEKRRALTAQMRAKMAQTQMRGEILKLKKQWQNLMKNFK